MYSVSFTYTLSIDDLQSIHPDIADDVYPWLELEAVLNKRDQLGGTSKKTVTQALYAELENWDAMKIASMNNGD